MVAEAAGVPYLLDTCQSVGQIPIDVTELHCDFLVGTSRKYLRGPRGMGLLYVAERWFEHLEPVALDLFGARWLAGDRYQMRPDARRFELFEQNMAAKAGLRAAVEYAVDVGVESSWARVQTLGTALRTLLSAIAGVEVLDRGPVRCGIVTFTVRGHTPAEVKAALTAQRINVSTSTIWSARYDMARNAPDGVVRASVHYYNTDDELELLARAVASL